MRRIELTLVVTALLVAVIATVLPKASGQGEVQLPVSLQPAFAARMSAWRAMSQSRRLALQQRLAWWHALPLQARRSRREQWQAWQALPPAQQALLRSAARDFASLPAVEQQQWRARFNALDGSEQHGWLLGPVLGADYPRLQPLLAQVPGDERDALLDALRTLDATARDDLALLAQRLPPQGRDGLRRGLIATPAANRAAWLHVHAGR